MDAGDTEKLAALVATFSPLLAGLMSGPLHPSVLSALGRTIVNDDQAGADEVAAALNAGGPDLGSRIHQAEQMLLAKLAVPGSPVAVGGGNPEAIGQQASLDRQQARQRQTASNDRVNGLLAYIVTAFFFLALLLVICLPYLHPMTAGPDGTPFPAGSIANNAVAQTLLGVLGTGWAAIISFYFGSSVGSKEKTALLTR